MSETGSGRFRDRVDIQANIATEGNPKTDYSGSAFYENWRARHHDVSGASEFRGQQVSDTIKSVVELYEDKTKPLLANMLIKFEGRKLFIVFIKRERHGNEPPRCFCFCKEREHASVN